ncbi:response regulator [Neptunomonas sp. XY-337]|uniref:response regulator n=1 Tax=Neptunomonas sp. XY-337 TaxID=2561897 RepID=UPI001F0E7F4B|nr:response regulator [Neptunomonas sp. XY-337]
MGAPIPVVICDDSSLARKQMARSLENWNVSITFAEHGLEAIEAIKEGKGDLLFLDLNMPIMDGYQVLERIRRDDLQSLVLVVSGDIQPDAHTRVSNLGALDFIKKPINAELLSDVLHQYGLLHELSPGEKSNVQHLDVAVDLKSYYQEISNVAMGRAGDRLARLLKAFVHLPIPRVNIISIEELDMALREHIGREQSATVTQGFSGPGIAGEALLMFTNSSIQDMARLLRYDGEINESGEREVLIDLANVLSGAFLNSLAIQLDVSLNPSAPVILGLQGEAPNISSSKHRWEKTLSIEISYRITEHNINCDLLILFTEDSLDELNERASFFE